MPNLVDNNTQIPAARVKMNDDNTGFVNRPWYRWFFNTYQALEAGRRYGSFYSTTTFTPATTNTAYALTFNNTYKRADGSDGGGTKRVYIWPRINGVNVGDSATEVTLTGASNDAAVAAWNFVLNLQKGDYFELIYSSSSTNISFPYVAASSPVPAIPSVILTVTSCVGV
ncbi:MAG: hypothetical protein EBS82_06340 [Methylocystaceae bacterium]|nr:hypothetical protein [Methylocystaceae bacterium]